MAVVMESASLDVAAERTALKLRRAGEIHP